jgi:hypothetical protein
MMESVITALKYDPEFDSFGAKPSENCVDSTGLIWNSGPRPRYGVGYSAVVPVVFLYPGTGIGNGTEQNVFTVMLGRPVTIPSVRSSEYKLHQIRTNVSFFSTDAEASSFRTWSPSK